MARLLRSPFDVLQWRCGGPSPGRVPSGVELGEREPLKRHHIALASAALFVSTQVSADALKEVKYGAPAAWVEPIPSSAADTKPSDAVFRFVYQDNQERVSKGTIESYGAYRVKILKPEALALGNIRIAWSPSAGTATVHFIRIIRNSSVIDVLEQAKLKVLEREAGLEQSMLDGNLTATLQVPDLRVGDELEFAATIARAEPAFGTHNAGVARSCQWGSRRIPLPAVVARHERDDDAPEQGPSRDSTKD